MANENQVNRLLAGVKGWNKWRLENPKVKPDLTGAYFSGVDLKGADLSNAVLNQAHLNEVNLNSANLNRAYLDDAVLAGAHLVRANLNNSHLAFAYLVETDLTESLLWDADLREAKLTESILMRARIGGTVFGNIDLSSIKGLDTVIHQLPSQINIGTLQLSKGKIPIEFLKGCGLSNWEIESAKLYRPGLSAKDVNDIVYKIYDLRANQAIQINNLFISYSHMDGMFVDSLEKYLDENGIRFWRDIHDATAGRLEKVVDRAIRQNPVMLLILSEYSVKSDWVEHEVRSARDLEKELGRDVICPVALDDAWKDCKWPARLREQIMEFNILDFSKWHNVKEFEIMFRKLIDGLDLFYKK